ncbi:MAG: HMA2 domain-containing protein [Bacillota bacterium]|nr:hypothetical protein [Bacillota bacterium]
MNALSKEKISLGLLGSLVACTVSVPFSKGVHKYLGCLFLFFSLLHSYQHRRSLVKYSQREVQKMKDFIAKGLGGFIRQKVAKTIAAGEIEVLHFLPGRVRLFAKPVVNHAANARAVAGYLNKLPEVRSFSVNPASGSILIEYDPANAASSDFLAELEGFVQSHYNRRSL